jgi:hypothetical protein
MKKKMFLIPLSFLIITSCGGEASTNPSAESTTAETTQTTTENTTPSVLTTTKEGTSEKDTTISTEDNTSSEGTSETTVDPVSNETTDDVSSQDQSSTDDYSSGNGSSDDYSSGGYSSGNNSSGGNSSGDYSSGNNSSGGNSSGGHSSGGSSGYGSSDDYSSGGHSSSNNSSGGSSNVVAAITSATLLPSDLPSSGSHYPEDQSITAKDGVSYYISFVMAGNQQTLKGVKTDVIQLKKSVGYFYNEDQPFTGTLTINVLDKGTYTGTPTIYVGSSEHPTTTQKEASIQRGEEFITYTYSINEEYITLANESSYALYLSSFVLA